MGLYYACFFNLLNLVQGAFNFTKYMYNCFSFFTFVSVNAIRRIQKNANYDDVTCETFVVVQFFLKQTSIQCGILNQQQESGLFMWNPQHCQMLQLIHLSLPVVEWLWDKPLYITSDANLTWVSSCQSRGWPYESPISTCGASSEGFDFYLLWQNPSPNSLHYDSRYLFCLSAFPFINS